MSKQKWLTEQKKQFDICLNDMSYESIMEAHEIILEVEHRGFKQEVVELEDRWGEAVKYTYPKFYKNYIEWREHE